MWCGTRLVDFETGNIVRTPGLTLGESLRTGRHLTNGAAIWLEVQADISYEVEIWGPSGLAERLAYDVTQHGAPAPVAQVLVCDATPGEWEIRVPAIRGTEHRMVRVHFVVVDATPSVLSALACMSPEKSAGLHSLHASNSAGAVRHLTQ